MEINGFWSVFGCGFFGAFFGELLKWYRIRENEELPHYAKSFVYWLITFFIMFSGGFLTVLYGIENINAILAVNIGLSAPLIIQNLSRSIPFKEKSVLQDKTHLNKKNSVKNSMRGFKLHSKISVRNFLSY